METIALGKDILFGTKLIKDLLKSINPEIKLISTIEEKETLSFAKKYLSFILLSNLNLHDISSVKVLEAFKIATKAI